MVEPSNATSYAEALENALISTNRFELRRELGSGAFGTVWAALDRECDQLVALKALHKLDATSLFRFKKEFRALADISHPHLVALRELFCVGGHWFLTMDLVEGQSYLHYIRGNPNASRVNDSCPTADFRLPYPNKSSITSTPETVPISKSDSPQFNERRLRSTLAQLAEGVLALHQAGKLHCDLKPLNVIIQPNGHLLILDFGLVSDFVGRDQNSELESRVIGTPAYMSPEHAGGLAVGPASDWYSVGVMLYECLTGRRPHQGSVLEVMSAKQTFDPLDPRLVAEHIPNDLAELAIRLLHRVPEQRPTGSDILRLLGEHAEEPSTRLANTPPNAPIQSLFFGRGEQLNTLHQLARRVEVGTPIEVHIIGLSGYGKSGLVSHFLSELTRSNAGWIVLKGRCLEQESVPYKGLDSLIDALTRYLSKLPDASARELMPLDVAALARVFPVLSKVRAVSEAPRTDIASDAQDLRRRAFAALRELLARLAYRHPLALYIDDLQWGDIDSAVFLRDIFEPPLRPAFLLLGCFREENVHTSEVLSTLRKPADSNTARIETHEILIGPLDKQSTFELALASFGTSGSEVEEQASAIATESLGIPFFVSELVHHAKELGGLAKRSDTTSALTLQNLVSERIQRLEPTARALLELVAVAGVPISLSTVQKACITGDNFRNSITKLRQGHLIRTQGSSRNATVEAYHDRVREAVVRSLSPEALCRANGALAIALENSGNADPEALARHFYAANDMDKAWQYTVAAAQRAEHALAFVRAAILYRQAISIQPDRDKLILLIRLGEALGNAGHGEQAAETYLEAADLAESYPDALPGKQEFSRIHETSQLQVQSSASLDTTGLRRRAAEQYLRNGQLDASVAILRRVFAADAIHYPETPLRALLSALFRRAAVRLRGLRFRERPASEVPSGLLARIDSYASISPALAQIDVMRGADFSARTLLLALRAGEPIRLLRALSVEATHTSTAGPSKAPRVETLLRIVSSLVERVQSNHARGWHLANAGMAQYFMGNFRVGADLLMQGETHFLAEGTLASWELNATRTHMISALAYLGQLDELGKRVPRYLMDTLDRGDLFGANNFRLGAANWSWLRGDHFYDAKRMADNASSLLAREGFNLQHWYRTLAVAQLFLYDRQGEKAHRLINEQWGALARSMLLRNQILRVLAWSLRARSALSTAHDNPDPSRRRTDLLHQSECAAHRVAKEKTRYAAPTAELILAGIAKQRGQVERAVVLAASAIKHFDDANMELHAAVSRFCYGGLLGSDEGRSFKDNAQTWMEGQGIKNPQRWIAMLAPGFDAV